MRRRALLAGLLAGVGPARGQAEAPWLAWGPQGLCWHDGAVTHRHAMPPQQAEPSAAARVWWGAGVDGRPWRLAPGAAAPVLGEPLPGPLHALAAAEGWLAMAHGNGLSLLDATLVPQRHWPAADLARRRKGVVAALAALPARRSLVATLPAAHELWELQLDPAAEPVYDGLVHDWRMGEGLARPGHLGLRRTPLAGPAPTHLWAHPRLPWVLGWAEGEAQVLHLDVRQVVARWPAAGPGAVSGAALHLGRGGEQRLWLPEGEAARPVDARRWVPGRPVALGAPVLQLLSAAGALWALVSEGSGRRLLRLADDGAVRGTAWQGPVARLATGSAGRAWWLCGEHTLWLGDGQGPGQATPLPPGPGWLGVVPL